MVNEYQIILNSTEDIQKELSKAEESGVVYDYYNAVIYVRGTPRSRIDVGRDLEGLYVVAQGPAEVRTLDRVSVIAEGEVLVRAHGGSCVTARDRSTVYAYDSALVTLEDHSTAHALSGDVDITACGDSRILVAEEYADDIREWAELRDNATVVLC